MGLFCCITPVELGRFAGKEDSIMKLEKERGMKRGKKRGKKVRKRIGILLAAALLLCAGGFWYVQDFYPSEAEIADFQEKGEGVLVTEITSGLYLDGPGRDTAMIFYPGAKVEYTAYLPMLYQLAKQGVDCFLIQMPCNLAILGQNRAERVMERYEYSHWYLSGHSLGGAMAASYAAGHLEKLEGLVLLAAYPTKSLESDGLYVLSVYGSEDQVLNSDKWKAGRAYMPEHYSELCIEGGNHAGFGCYGRQDGDGLAAVSSKEQQRQTAEAIEKMIRERQGG